MILTNHTNNKNLPTSSRSSLYKETIALRQLANQAASQQAEEEESDLGLDLGGYVKIIATLSGIALLAGFIAAALTQ
jgi:hypothetical protein